MSTEESDQIWNYNPVPKDAGSIFRIAWQIENWLRTMVYVEFRAFHVNWEEPIMKVAGNAWPPSSKASDKKLHHMTTPHQAALSYLTFGQLWSAISDSKNWELFEPYFPPKHITEPKIEEFKAIRNRIAHFREPHLRDLKRLRLFAEDLESGIREFCVRYTQGKFVNDSAQDPVSELLATSWEQLGYGVELHCPNGSWLYAPGRHLNKPHINADIQYLSHKRYSTGSPLGVVYKLNLSSNSGNKFDPIGFIENSEGLHSNLIHLIIIGPETEPSITIPAVIGTEKVVEIIAAFLELGIQHSRGHSFRNMQLEKPKWPEYILQPGNVLTFFNERMEESILDLN